ncbi:MAG: hypothetical protein [Cressdnaviricota sp.]|nr:MAG: hypothetical protein [Cressdnaviricota sp.]
MNILEALKCQNRQSDQLLAEALPDSLSSCIINDIRNDFAMRDTASEHYVLSSYAIQKLTISDKMFFKRHRKKFNTVDNDVMTSIIRADLRKYILRNVPHCRLVLYPELGGQTIRYHLHGMFNGDLKDIDKIIKWWRRHYGHANYKTMSGSVDAWASYMKPVSRLIVISKL